MRTLQAIAIAGLLLMPGAAVAADLSAVTVRDAAGGERALGDLVDGPTIIHFWATWCAPCLEELPQLDAFAEGLEAGQLVVVSVDTAPYERIEDYLGDLEAGLKSYQQVEGSVGSVFGILGYPSTFVVDGAGAVLWRQQGAVEWNDPSIGGAILALL